MPEIVQVQSGEQNRPGAFLCKLIVSSLGEALTNNHKIKCSITNRNKIMKKKYRDCLESMLVAVVAEGQYFASAFLGVPMITPCNSLALRWLY